MSAPNIFDENESPLTNWIDSGGKPYTKTQVISVAKNYDNLLHIQNDFFRNEGTAFRKAVNKATGFDGVEKTFADGT